MLTFLLYTDGLQQTKLFCFHRLLFCAAGGRGGGWPQRGHQQYELSAGNESSNMSCWDNIRKFYGSCGSHRLCSYILVCATTSQCPLQEIEAWFLRQKAITYTFFVQDLKPSPNCFWFWEPIDTIIVCLQLISNFDRLQFWTFLLHVDRWKLLCYIWVPCLEVILNVQRSNAHIRVVTSSPIMFRINLQFW